MGKQIFISEDTYDKLKRFARLTHRTIMASADMALDDWLFAIGEADIQRRAEKEVEQQLAILKRSDDVVVGRTIGVGEDA